MRRRFEILSEHGAFGDLSCQEFIGSGPPALTERADTADDP